MLSLVVASVVSAAPPTAAQASAFAKAKQWEELYLAFAAATPGSYGKADRKKLAGLLTQGCEALQGDDPVMAFSLGEKSSEFEATANGLFCTALTAKRAEQRGAAEDALKRGASLFKNDGRFALELGRLYLEDGQPGEAAAALSKVGKKAKEWPEATRLLAQVSSQAVSVGGPKVTVDEPGGAPAQARPRSSPMRAMGDSLSWESGEDEGGRRYRQNRYFRIRYFNAKRDFGQRAEYEGSVQGALEDSRVTVQQLMGVAREKPLDVILYSREEFVLHHGAQAAQAVAGFYSGDAIRMNDSAEINENNRATLVHEYVHAVIDELLAFRGRTLPTWMNEGTAEYVEWRSLGRDGPPPQYDVRLRQLAGNNQLPPLDELSQGPLIASRNPGLAYAVSAIAVGLLVKRGTMAEVVELIRDCGRGENFAKALERRFGTTTEKLDEEIIATLKAR